MNWTRALLAGIVGGIAVNVADFIQHGMLLADTYTRYPVFATEQANPLYFTAISLLTGIFAAILFAKSRMAWAEGVKGGVTFGFLLGLFLFFMPFYNPLVIEGFPYYLSWCWGGINLIDAVIFGAVAGAIYKRPQPQES